MADDADMAAEITQETMARGLARISADIPVGSPGECVACGRDSPRLVNRVCAPCRDRADRGRRGGRF